MKVMKPEDFQRLERNRAIKYRRERALGMSLGAWQRRAKKAKARDLYQCVWCKSTENLTIDHIVALQDGGTNDLNNLRTLCLSCHHKHNREVGH